MTETRKPVNCGTRTLCLTPSQIKFKRKSITLTKDLHLSGLLPETLKAGRTFKTLPLYREHLGTALSGEDGAVYVALSPCGRTSCWVPAGYWK